MKVRAFITHKLSEHYSDCQDRFCIKDRDCRIAISDGMSQSIFPDYWAEILSRYYAEHGHCTDEDRKELCKKWLEMVVHFISQEMNSGKNPWRLRNCIEAQNGAGATICGISFKNATEWEGQVLGDSCVIEVNDPYDIKIHTSESKAFDSYPDYYESFPNKTGRGTIKNISGEISDSNYLLLVSDPFSEFLYNNKDKSAEWLNKIRALNSHEDYCSLVDDWRTSGLHNDDSTLCIIEYDGSDKMNIEFSDDINKLIAKENEISKPIENISDIESEESNSEEIIKNEIEPIGQKQPHPIADKKIESNSKNENEEPSNDNAKICNKIETEITNKCNIHKNNGKQKTQSRKFKKGGSNKIWENEFDTFCKEVIVLVINILKRIK